MTIYKALIKYGYSQFKLDILEYCDLKQRIIREQHYFDTLNPEYNILKVAGSPLGRKHSKETIAKMRAAALGLKRSQETKDKIRAASLNRTIEHKNNISVAKMIPVNVTCLKTNLTVTYASIRQAAEKLNINYITLTRDVKSQKIYKNKYKITIRQN